MPFLLVADGSHQRPPTCAPQACWQTHRAADGSSLPIICTSSSPPPILLTLAQDAMLRSIAVAEAVDAGVTAAAVPEPTAAGTRHAPVCLPMGTVARRARVWTDQRGALEIVKAGSPTQAARAWGGEPSCCAVEIAWVAHCRSMCRRPVTGGKSALSKPDVPPPTLRRGVPPPMRFGAGCCRCCRRCRAASDPGLPIDNPQSFI